jgi:hypothetical protein
MNEALLIFAGFIAHAWIGKIASPAATGVGWVVGGLLTVIALWLVLTRTGLLH